MFQINKRKEWILFKFFYIKIKITLLFVQDGWVVGEKDVLVLLLTGMREDEGQSQEMNECNYGITRIFLMYFLVVNIFESVYEYNKKYKFKTCCRKA